MVADVAGFFRTANRLKWTERKGWVEKVFVKSADAESVADHCYQMALMCLVLADMKRLNSSKAVKMALLHDLAESIIGDYTPEEISTKAKKEEEDRAMKRIFAGLPPRLRRSYERLWQEYKQKSSKEAILVGQVDKFEMALQAHDYAHKGYDEGALKEFVDSARTNVKDKTLLKLLNSLKQSGS